MQTRWGTLAATMLAVTAGANAGNTIHVPLDQPGIQAGIDAASNGDTVLVAPGLYVENINFRGKAITVISEQGGGATIIDGGGRDTVATFASGEGLSSVLSGFTLQNGLSTFSTPSFGDGGGVSIRNTSPTIQNNLIWNNRACNGIGIHISFGSPLIQGNTITTNTRTGCSGGIGGAGLAINGPTTAQILNNVITHNSLFGGGGGGLSLFGAGAPTIRGNIISQNSVDGVSPCASGGGITIGGQSDAVIVNNLITSNSAWMWRRDLLAVDSKRVARPLCYKQHHRGKYGRRIQRSGIRSVRGRFR